MADIGQKIVCNLSATATVRHVVYHNHCTLCVQTSTAISHQAGNNTVLTNIEAEVVIQI